jgi:hypothetical protein
LFIAKTSINVNPGALPKVNIYPEPIVYHMEKLGIHQKVVEDFSIPRMSLVSIYIPNTIYPLFKCYTSGVDDN